MLIESAKARRLASLAFLVALLILATRTCQGEMASAEIHFVAATYGPSVRHLEARLYPQDAPDEVVGVFEKTISGSAASPVGVWSLSADSGPYRLAIEVSTDADVYRFDRRVELRDGARITVDLDRDIE